jgi:RHS repeat-associated protein
MYPYDWSQAFAQNVGHSPCASRGFTYAQSHTTWLGTQPPPSSASNVQTGFEVLTVDDFGNVLTARNQNDLFRSDDDLCLEMTYAQPTSSARFFSKLASRRITNCISGAELRTLGYETWEYDALPLGSVSSGRVTSQSIERHATDDGQNLGLIREYEADFDAVGNTSYIASAREDGAVRTLEIAYDEFGLVPASTRLSATALGPFVTAMDLDPITLDVRATLDTNGTSWGSEVDGFGRPTRTTVTPPGGTLGVASATSYAGFAGESSGREIRVSTFTDPVPPAEVGTAWGHDRTAYLDEIGRTRRVEQELGNDYANETLVEMSRVYDGLGRISFEADPYPASQSESTAYGTTYHFRTDGMLECAVRGNGPQALTTISDLTTETFPTCLTRVFDNHTVQVLVNSPDALLAGSPQAGVVRTDTMTAIGRLLSRESTKNGARLELATYAYDRFGNLAALSRYQDPQNFAAAVSWSWRFDSLGQQLLATEPQMANRSWTYSNWGELRSVDWTDTTVSPSVAMQVEQGFDALGRISTSMEKEDGNAIPETEYAWFYDTDPGGPLPGTTFTAGRLTQTHSPIGNMYLSYDAFGRADARAFLDLNSEPYIEKYGWHLDGNPSFLEFELPDTNYSTEHFDYAYDTASRLRSVTTPGEQLFSADEIDPFGRLRAAVYGQSVAFTATDADTGRRLPIDEQVSLPSGDHRRIVHDAYDSVGRELQRHEDRGVANNPSTTNAYDALGRLAVSQEQDTSQPPTPATLDLESITTAGNLVGVFAEALVWGASGNSIRVGLEDDALLGVDVTEDGNDVTIHFERDVTTVEELVQTVNASSSLIHLVGSYNAVFVLQSGDVAPLTNLTGGSDGSPAVSSSFTFDSLGNVRSLTDSNSQTDLTYDAVDEDRVCRVDYDGTPGGSCNVVYDGSGNVLEQPTRDGNRHLTYFPSGATRSIVQDSIDPVTGQSRTAQAAFRYDASGEMFELDVEGTAPSDPRHDRRYGLIERRDVGGSSIIVRHILGQGGLVASRRGANGPWIFPFADARGMRFATDDRDEFVQDVSYSPFGKASSYGAARGTSEYTSQQWNGGDALADFGLVHLGARIYDPVIGRFLSRDPLKIARSASKTNPYAFSLNDPINYADPSGMDCEIPDGPCDSSQLSIKESIAALSAGYDLLFGRNTSASSQGTSTKASAVAIDNGLLSIQVSAPFAGSDGADFYDALRRKRGLDYEIDSYLGPPGIAQVVSAISWVYGDPTQDIGKLPPVRVVARTLVEYFLARGGEDVDAKIVSTSAGRAASTELEPIAVGLSGSASHSRNLVARFADKVGALTYWDIYADVPSQPEILARMMTQFEQRPIMVNLSGFDQVRNLGIEEGLRAIVREPFKQTTEGEITSILMNQGFFGRARFFLNGDEVLLDRSAIIAP